MFQTYDEPSLSGSARTRLQDLRQELRARRLDGFLVPHSDEHQNEFLPASAERLFWLTGFSGSAGTAVVTLDRAALFIDGRYRLQARQQAEGELYEILEVPEHKPAHWIGQALKEGERLGYDVNLHTVAEIERLTEALAPSGIVLVPQPDNPIDLLWRDRPQPSSAPAYPQPLALAGQSAAEKIAALQATLKSAKTDAAVLTLLDSIAWLFNMRGSDIKHTPLVLSYAIVPATGRPSLFVDLAKIGNSLRDSLDDLVEFYPVEALDDELTALGETKARVRLDPATAPVRFESVLKQAGATVLHGPDPCIAVKAIKTDAEIEGARAAHRRDGAAVTRFLAWLDLEAPKGLLDEVSASMKLESFRADTGALKEISFDSISAAGPHGAIVHYRPMSASKLPLSPDTLYLIDSGAQYEDGTTDVTRTIAIGAPNADMRRHYTLVLKGHIAISRARFPAGTRGQDLDPLARAALWQAGLDYDHGTGHGVGSFLSVHEGPQRLSKQGTVALKPGMILSNEPGYYREGEYGIRIENLVLVTPAEAIPGGEREMMGFETLTLVAYDRRLIETALLTAQEIAWINAYHARVRETLEPLVPAETRAWLAAATAPLP
jgi:Xaa-Pro aminopeptidase